MIEVRPIQTLDSELVRQLIRGYVSHEKYRVTRQKNDTTISFVLQLAQLESPFVKQFELEPIEHYQQICNSGFSLAAYEQARIVGIALTEPRTWNRSLWIHEFHILGEYQRKGVGRTLMDAVTRQAQVADLRIMVCETQNTNVPAIRFYNKMGFNLEGLDLSLYTNQDWPNGEIALWMKRKVVVAPWRR